MSSRTQSREAHVPGASTDERAPPFLLAGEAAAEGAATSAPPANDPPVPVAPDEAFWAGVRHGIAEAQRRAAHPHLPPELDPTSNGNLTRASTDASLTSARLASAFDAAPPAAPGARAARHDGWTPEKERIFCTTLAGCGVVADACRAAGMSRDAAYARRRAASGRAFALAWNAAELLARAPVAEAVMSRAMNGVVDRVYKDGALVAERHRYDNRLTMAVLARLDRVAEGAAPNTGAVRAAAEEFEQLLDLLPGGNAAAEAFLAPRLGANPLEPPHLHDVYYTRGSEPNLLARCAFHEKHGVGMPSDIPVDDLDSAEMERWDDDQLRRAEASGYLASLEDDEDWPELALDDEAEGACASAGCPRHGTAGAEGEDGEGMCKLRKLYLSVGPGRYDEDYAICWPDDDDEEEEEEEEEEEDEEEDEEEEEEEEEEDEDEYLAGPP